MRVPEITVFGQPRSSTLDMVPTRSELSGLRLQRKKQSTIGETLSRETGVTSTQFGQNASRPVIRGLEGDRIRVLQNGTGVLDASTASQDHAVPMDPLIIERVEIVRGAAALLYGSSALGGVVNMETSRLPTSREFAGRAEARGSSVDMGRAGGVAVTGEVGGGFVAHADGSLRASEDYGTPEGRVHNSWNRTASGAVGGSYVFDNGYVGSSFADYGSDYGVVAEEFVTIAMKQRRWDVAGEWKSAGLVRSVRARNTYSDYHHSEIEGGEVGTRFGNVGDEARVDLKHAALAGFEGVFGLQFNGFQFSAKGDEAFLPDSENRALAAFLFEEYALGRWRPSFGARLERNEVESVGDREFGLASFALGLSYQLDESNQLVLNLAQSERAPNYQELFANGRHVATRQHEIGDPDLGVELSRSVELSWRRKSGSFGVFMQDFRDFISLSPTGASDGDPDEPFEFYNYRAVSARLYGAEFEYRCRLSDFFELEFKIDSVRGVNRDDRADLPRMTPIRETVALLYKADLMQADLSVERSERQGFTAPNETETREYTLVGLGAERRFGAVDVFVRANNIFDQEARNHVSVLKEIAPLPGRNFVLGARTSF